MRQLQRLLSEAACTLAQAARTFARDEAAGWEALQDAAVAYAAVLEVDQERRDQAHAARRAAGERPDAP